MESEAYKRDVGRGIKKRIVDLQVAGVKTSKGEPLSLAAIARTRDPPVTRTMVSLVAQGKAESRRVKKAIEKELGQLYWIRRA